MKLKTYKSEYSPNELYYNLDRALSYQCDVVFSMSVRNLGKSYSARKIVKNAMKKGYNCAWLRWSLSESEVAAHKFLENEENYHTKKSQYSNIRVIESNENRAQCHFLSVKSATSARDYGIDNLKYVIYDECVPEFYDVKTRRETEFDKLMSIFTTIKRNSDAKLIMICNCLDWFNPFFVAWNIFPFNSGLIKVFTKNVVINEKNYTQKILVENVKPSDAMLDRVARLEVLKGNFESIQDYFNNVMKKQYNLTESCPYLDIPLAPMQIRLGNKFYSYRRLGDTFFFVETKKRDVETESPDISDIDKNETRTTQIGKQLELMLNRGLCRFENGAVFNAICSAIAKYRTIL